MSEALPETGRRHCWLCERPIDDPPEIIGQIIVGEVRLAHMECVRFANTVERDTWWSL